MIAIWLGGVVVDCVKVPGLAVGVVSAGVGIAPALFGKAGRMPGPGFLWFYHCVCNDTGAAPSAQKTTSVVFKIRVLKEQRPSIN